MGQGKNVMKMDVVRIKFAVRPRADAYFVTSKFIDTLVLGASDLKRDLKRRAAQRYTMSARDFTTYLWRTRILIRELEQMGPDAKLRLVEWSIQSDKESFFHVSGAEYATDVIQLITPCRAYWCKETPSSLISGIDIFQHEVGGRNGEPTRMEDVPPFYHSMEKCSIMTSPCTEWLSCHKNCSGTAAKQPSPSAETISIEAMMKAYSAATAVKPTTSFSDPHYYEDPFSDMPSLSYQPSYEPINPHAYRQSANY